MEGRAILGTKTELVPRYGVSQNAYSIVLLVVFWVGYFCLGGSAIKGMQDSQDCFGVFLSGDFEKHTHPPTGTQITDWY